MNPKLDKSVMTNKKGGAKGKPESSQKVETKAIDNLNKNDDKPDLDDIYGLIDLYFKQKNVMYTHLYNSFDKFLDEDVRSLLEKGNNVFFEKITKDKVYRYKFVYENIAIKPPMLDAEDDIMFPSHARARNLTYGAKLVATIKQVQDVIDIATDKITSRIIGTPEYEYPIANIPILVRSKYCALNLKKGYDKTECEYDPGGYFIVNGSEKVVMSLERMINNKPLVFMKKDSSANIYTVQVNSYSQETEAMQIATVRIRKDNVMTLRVPILSEIPVFIVMRALGVESDRDIINYVVYDKNDTDMLNLVRISLENSKSETSNEKITTQEEAINYLINKMRVMKKYSETDEDVRKKEKKMHLMSLLKNNFLPHVEGDLIDKAYFLGYMINRLLQCFLERIPIDDRDSFSNKRIDLPGALLFDLFKQFYKKMLNECNKFFKKRISDDNNPPVIINQIKPNTIEQGLKTALLTGAWAKKKGVAQMLQRMTYVQTLSSLRRINSPTVDASTNKLTSPRHLHPSSIGFICYIETSEGHKVGLVKNLALMGNVTVMMTDQIENIKSILRDRIKKIQDIPSSDLKEYTRVFLNGEWLGVTDDPRTLYKELKEMKYRGEIDVHSSIIHEIKSEVESRELKIYCDGGRMFRPVLRVENNKLLLTKSHIDMISLEGSKNPTKISSWNEFIAKNPGIVEYIDVDEQANSMISMFPDEVDLMYNRMTDTVKSVAKLDMKENQTVVNRYDDFTYVKYTHCEIHPSMHIGVVACNIPFCNRNQGPRNIYQYSQARTAMGIYSTNWRYRLDISYILYHPQRPIVTTRSMKYVNTDKIPAGENAIVAIACYTGYNQEDSVIMNQSAVDRGLYRSTSLYKHMTTIQKNQSTSQDDLFIKPDPTTVTGMRHGTYDKLNEYGFVPKNTPIVKGDIILAKVSPIQPVGNSTKKFKDNSEVYKSGVPGMVDEVYTDIFNQEGYEMRKMRVRSMRTPHIGDKMCSRSGQKGTIGITLKQSDMPFTKHGITPDIIMNPNAMPSRMTIGQFIECLVGKISALKGHETDSTPFNKIDIDQIKDILEGLGYERNGNEYLYNGMTGRKMRTMIFMGPTYYQRLKHMVSDKQHCLTMDHEVLTLEGWKTYDKLTMNDEVATLDDGELKYQKPKALLYYPEFKGRTYQIKSQQVDLHVTDNHRMYVSYPKDGAREWQPYDLIEAKNIYGKLVQYKKDATWLAQDYQFVLPPITDGNNVVREEKIVDMDAWLSFFGILITDSWTTFKDNVLQNPGRYGITICQCKERVRKVILDSLTKLGYDYVCHDDKIDVTDEQLFTYMKQLSVDTSNKKLPDWAMKLSAKQSKLLLDSMVLGNDTYSKICEYYSSSKELVEQFGQLCLHAGYSSDSYIHIPKGQVTYIDEREVVNAHDIWRASIVQTKNKPVHEQDIQYEKFSDYEGPVFCLEVPTEVFYVRRNGIAVWTGNSRSRGPRTVLTRQPPEGRSRDGGLRLGEMERDSLLAHGAARYLKEKTVESADAYTTHVCGVCGLFAQRLLKRDNKPYTTSEDVYHCPACKNKTDIAKIRIPYAFKLLLQEMMSMNIAPRIRVRKNQFE
jgi:DNA-directed RNA polymerase II subunit RPB2